MRKTQLVVLAMLMFSVVATGFVLAEESSASVSADSVVTEVNAGVSLDDVASLDEATATDVPSSWKARTAIEAMYGQGYTDEGKFANMVVLSKTFVNSAKTEESRTVLRGKLAVGDTKYGLRATSDDSGVMDGTVTFDVYKESTKIGTLTLDVTNTYGDMKIRTGEFIDGSQLTIATKTRGIQKPVRAAKVGTARANSAEIQADGDSELEARAVPAQEKGFRGFLNRIFARKTAVRAEAQAQ